MRALNGLQHQGFGQFAYARFYHHHAVARAGDDYVQRAFFKLAVGGVDHEAAAHVAHAGYAYGAFERDVGHRQRGGRSHEAQHVQGRFLVDGHGGEYYLDFVAEALGEERAKGAVGEAGYEDAVCAGPAFSPEEAAGDFAPGVEPLFELDCEGEEVDSLSGLAHGCGGEYYAIALAHEHGAVG